MTIARRRWQPMGWTSEMVAQTYNISRQKQDEYALISHTRAAKVSLSPPSFVPGFRAQMLTEEKT
jgi:uncharacterized protein YecA (UPF0149 family)